LRPPSLRSLRFPFFDPERGEYAEAISKPIALQVEEVRTVTAHDAQGLINTPNSASGSELKTIAEGIAHNYSSEKLLRDERTGMATWSNTPWKISFLLAWPGIYLLSLSAVTWKKRKLANPEALAAQNARKNCLAKLKKLPATGDNCPELALTAINDFLTAKLRLPPAAAQSFREVKTPLQEAGVDDATLERLENLLTDCEACRYAGAKNTDTQKLLAETVRVVKEIDRIL